MTAGAGSADGATAVVQLMLNGRPRTAIVGQHRTLLEALRSDFGLTGTKECCLVGECGACTVLLDGRSVDSCLVLALEADGAQVVTVEGLAGEDGLDPLQQAFLDHGAAQCGFCIPGQLVAARALLDTNSAPSRADVEEGLAGNLCRCAGYEQIIEAVLDAATRTRRGAEGPRAVGGAPDERVPESAGDPAATPDATVAPQ